MTTHHRPGLRRLLVAALVSSSALTVALAPGASAGTRVISDPQDGRLVDIRRVQVAYEKAVKVKVGHDSDTAAGQTYSFWLDTRPANPGPEFAYSFLPNTDSGALFRIGSFDDSTATEVPCRVTRYADIFKPRAPVTLRIPAGCLSEPKRVRVSVRFQHRTDVVRTDWAPGRRAFGPWVNRF